MKILQIGMGNVAGGLEAFVMNYYRVLVHMDIQFDFVCMYDKIAYEEEIRKLGGRIYYIPNVKKNYQGYIKELKKILKETPFELESAECEEKISTLYNWYCKEYYAAEPLKYFDDYSLDEVLKKSNIRVKWNEKFDEIQKAKNKFLNLRIAK